MIALSRDHSGLLSFQRYYGHSGLSFTVLAEPEAFDMMVLLKELMDTAPESAGAFAVNDGHLGKPGKHRIIKVLAQDDDRFFHVHAPDIRTRRYVHCLGHPDRCGAAPLELVRLFVHQFQIRDMHIYLQYPGLDDGFPVLVRR